MHVIECMMNQEDFRCAYFVFVRKSLGMEKMNQFEPIRFIKYHHNLIFLPLNKAKTALASACPLLCWMVTLHDELYSCNTNS